MVETQVSLAIRNVIRHFEESAIYQQSRAFFFLVFHALAIKFKVLFSSLLESNFLVWKVNFQMYFPYWQVVGKVSVKPWIALYNNCLRRRRTDILYVGESTKDVGQQGVGKTTRRRNDRNSFVLLCSIQVTELAPVVQTVIALLTGQITTQWIIQ